MRLERCGGARAETFVACHLLNAVETWTNLGFGDFELRYLRDKQKRETDFLIVRDRKPWFLVEVKLTDTTLSPSLAYFQEQIGASHAFQAVLNLPLEKAYCFAAKRPQVVPAQTLLSQLPQQDGGPTYRITSRRDHLKSCFLSDGTWRSMRVYRDRWICACRGLHRLLIHDSISEIEEDIKPDSQADK